MKRIVDLATCHVTQLTSEREGRGEWVVYNDERKEIHRFPSDWDEKKVMEVIHFGRKFELIAMNAGIEFQKQKTPDLIKTLQSMVRNLTAEKDIILKRNETLANELKNLNKQLDKLTIKS